MTCVVIIKCHFADLRLIKFDAVTCVEHMSTRLATSSFTQRLSLVWLAVVTHQARARLNQVSPARGVVVRFVVNADNERLIYG